MFVEIMLCRIVQLLDGQLDLKMVNRLSKMAHVPDVRYWLIVKVTSLPLRKPWRKIPIALLKS